MHCLNVFWSLSFDLLWFLFLYEPFLSRIQEESSTDMSSPAQTMENTGLFMLRKDSERRATLHRILTDYISHVVSNIQESVPQVCEEHLLITGPPARLWFWVWTHQELLASYDISQRKSSKCQSCCFSVGITKNWGLNVTQQPHSATVCKGWHVNNLDPTAIIISYFTQGLTHVLQILSLMCGSNFPRTKRLEVIIYLWVAGARSFSLVPFLIAKVHIYQKEVTTVLLQVFEPS